MQDVGLVRCLTFDETMLRQYATGVCDIEVASDGCGYAARLPSNVVVGGIGCVERRESFKT